MGALFGGYLSDKYEKVNYMSKAWIILAANGISIPFCMAGFLQTESFWFAIVMVSIQWFFTELWISPVITMTQNSSSARNQATMISIFYLLASLSGIVSTAALGYFSSQIDGVSHPEAYGQVLTFANCFP